jgi:hypothetical protein
MEDILYYMTETCSCVKEVCHDHLPKRNCSVDRVLHQREPLCMTGGPLYDPQIVTG